MDCALLTMVFKISSFDNSSISPVLLQWCWRNTGLEAVMILAQFFFLAMDIWQHSWGLGPPGYEI